jgi:hypothetical protein
MYQVNAQEKLPRKLKKLGLTADNLAYYNGPVPGYPHGLIYNINQPDSVYYFGCLASDVDAMEDFFEEQNYGENMHVDRFILRIAGSDTLKIGFNSLTEELKSYTDINNKHFDKIDLGNTNFVIMYYCCSALYVDLKGSIKVLNKFVKDHPEKQMKFYAVCTDK